MKTKKDQSFGIIPVFKDKNGVFLFCLVRHADGHWAFPKGHKEENESERDAALRELKEETGIVLRDAPGDQIFTEYYSFEKDGIRYDKSVKYFIGLTSSTIAATQDDFKNEISDLRWLPYEEAKNIITFPEAKRILDEAVRFLSNR